MTKIAEKAEQQVLEQFADSYQKQNRRWGVRRSMTEARDLLSSALSTTSGVLERMCGKELLSSLSAWAVDECGVSFGAATLAAELRADELDVEVREILRAVSRAQNFTPRMNTGWWEHNPGSGAGT